MAEPYLTELRALLEDLSKKFEDADSVTCKHFFSGAAAYFNGQIFMSLSPVGLAFKLPEEHVQNVLNQGGKPLKYFPKAPVKKGYAVLSPQQTTDQEALLRFFMLSIRQLVEKSK